MTWGYFCLDSEGRHRGGTCRLSFRLIALLVFYGLPIVDISLMAICGSDCTNLLIYKYYHYKLHSDWRNSYWTYGAFLGHGESHRNHRDPHLIQLQIQNPSPWEKGMMSSGSLCVCFWGPLAPKPGCCKATAGQNTGKVIVHLSLLHRPFRMGGPDQRRGIWSLQHLGLRKG